MQLTDAENAELNDILARVHGGKVTNIEALDGFFAAIACCPEMILPSEYLPVIQSGAEEDDDLVFENMEEAQRFMTLLARHYNHVNTQLNSDEAYLPLLLEDDDGDWTANDWARGFLAGTHMRHEIWSEIVESEEHGGGMIPIFALAYEDDPDPTMRPFEEPIDDEKRTHLVAAAAAGVMHMHRYFRDRRDNHRPQTGTFVRRGRKIGRNDPCPCGSGRKYKRCCGRSGTVH